MPFHKPYTRNPNAPKRSWLSLFIAFVFGAVLASAVTYSLVAPAAFKQGYKHGYNGLNEADGPKAVTAYFGNIDLHIAWGSIFQTLLAVVILAAFAYVVYRLVLRGGIWTAVALGVTLVMLLFFSGLTFGHIVTGIVAFAAWLLATLKSNKTDAPPTVTATAVDGS